MRAKSLRAFHSPYQGMAKRVRRPLEAQGLQVRWAHMSPSQECRQAGGSHCSSMQRPPTHRFSAKYSCIRSSGTRQNAAQPRAPGGVIYEGRAYTAAILLYPQISQFPGGGKGLKKLSRSATLQKISPSGPTQGAGGHGIDHQCHVTHSPDPPGLQRPEQPNTAHRLQV